jgi:dihydroflavonol-4-reductase
VTADLTEDAGWAEAVAGCAYVLHVASPFPMDPPRHADEVVVPAREGALRLLRAATGAGVGRVVLTSSIVAISLGNKPKGHVYTEADWSDPERRDITAYAISKTLAERAAWDFVARTPGAPELTTIAPAFVLGPALDADLSTSHEVIRLMARGVYPAAPRVGFPVSDVRDVAAAHATAMTHPRAAGERFIVAEGLMHLIQLGGIVADVCPDLRAKVPKFELPDFVVRAAAMVDRRLKAVLPDLGHPRLISNAKAREMLGLEPRSAETAARAAVESLRALKVI